MTSTTTRLRHCGRYDDLLNLVCELEDGSAWAVTAEDEARAERWTAGDAVEVAVELGLAGRLSNLETGESVSAIRYAAPTDTTMA